MKIHIIILLLLSLVTLQPAYAKKKKKAVKRVQREYVRYNGGSFSFVHNEIRIVGNIYELKVSTTVDGVTIDSLWFGNTPVPCDVYETKTMHRLKNPLPIGNYIIKANQDLYRYFYRNIDSTRAYGNFIAPFEFKGAVVIMYHYRDKRYYKTINMVSEKPQKQMRDSR